MWYLTLHRYIKTSDEAKSVLDNHLEWTFRQHQTGRVLFSGPTSDKSMGIIVLRADSIEEANMVLGTEPFIMQGFRTYEIYEWEVHQVLGVGSFNSRSR